MAEKDRKPGQNGKGSESRVNDIKRYQSNWSEINWDKDEKIWLKKVLDDAVKSRKTWPNWAEERTNV